MGLDIHEVRRYNGDEDPNPLVRGVNAKRRYPGNTRSKKMAAWRKSKAGKKASSQPAKPWQNRMM